MRSSTTLALLRSRDPSAIPGLRVGPRGDLGSRSADPPRAHVAVAPGSAGGVKGGNGLADPPPDSGWALEPQDDPFT